VHRIGERIGKEQEVEARGIELASELLPVLEGREAGRIAALVRPRVADEARREFLERSEN
jgi:hypothetical protein